MAKYRGENGSGHESMCWFLHKVQSQIPRLDMRTCVYTHPIHYFAAFGSGGLLSL